MKIKEIWKDIKDYEGLYQVSNLGRVRSLDRYVDTISNGITTKRKIKGNVLSLKISKYAQVSLCKFGVITYHYVHRLVAQAFIPNPLDLPEVNHKNGKWLDNQVDNLEWIDRKGNCEHAVANSLLGQMRPINVYHLHYGLIDTLPSISEAKRKYSELEHQVDPSWINKIMYGHILFQVADNDTALDSDGSVTFNKRIFRWSKIVQLDLEFNILNTFSNEVEAHSYISPDRKNNGYIVKKCRTNHYYNGFLWYFEEDYKYFKENNLLKPYKSNKKRVAQYSLDGEYIRTFDTINEAEKMFSKNGAKTSAIGHVLSDKLNNVTAYGFIWKEV